MILGRGLHKKIKIKMDEKPLLPQHRLDRSPEDRRQLAENLILSSEANIALAMQDAMFSSAGAEVWRCKA